MAIDTEKQQLIREYRSIIIKNPYDDEDMSRMEEIEIMLGMTSEDMEALALHDYQKQY